MGQLGAEAPVEEIRRVPEDAAESVVEGAALDRREARPEVAQAVFPFAGDQPFEEGRAHQVRKRAAQEALRRCRSARRRRAGSPAGPTGGAGRAGSRREGPAEAAQPAFEVGGVTFGHPGRRLAADRTERHQGAQRAARAVAATAAAGAPGAPPRAGARSVLQSSKMPSAESGPGVVVKRIIRAQPWQRPGRAIGSRQRVDHHHLGLAFGPVAHLRGHPLANRLEARGDVAGEVLRLGGVEEAVGSGFERPPIGGGALRAAGAEAQRRRGGGRRPGKKERAPGERPENVLSSSRLIHRAILAAAGVAAAWFFSRAEPGDV